MKHSLHTWLFLSLFLVSCGSGNGGSGAGTSSTLDTGVAQVHTNTSKFPQGEVVINTESPATNGIRSMQLRTVAVNITDFVNSKGYSVNLSLQVSSNLSRFATYDEGIPVLQLSANALRSLGWQQGVISADEQGRPIVTSYFKYINSSMGSPSTSIILPDITITLDDSFEGISDDNLRISLIVTNQRASANAPTSKLLSFSVTSSENYDGARNINFSTLSNSLVESDGTGLADNNLTFTFESFDILTARSVIDANDYFNLSYNVALNTARNAALSVVISQEQLNKVSNQMDALTRVNLTAAKFAFANDGACSLVPALAPETGIRGRCSLSGLIEDRQLRLHNPYINISACANEECASYSEVVVHPYTIQRRDDDASFVSYRIAGKEDLVYSGDYVQGENFLSDFDITIKDDDILEILGGAIFASEDAKIVMDGSVFLLVNSTAGGSECKRDITELLKDSVLLPLVVNSSSNDILIDGQGKVAANQQLYSNKARFSFNDAGHYLASCSLEEQQRYNAAIQFNVSVSSFSATRGVIDHPTFINMLVPLTNNSDAESGFSYLKEPHSPVFSTISLESRGAAAPNTRFIGSGSRYNPFVVITAPTTLGGNDGAVRINVTILDEDLQNSAYNEVIYINVSSSSFSGVNRFFSNDSLSGIVNFTVDLDFSTEDLGKRKSILLQATDKYGNQAVHPVYIIYSNEADSKNYRGNDAAINPVEDDIGMEDNDGDGIVNSYDSAPNTVGINGSGTVNDPYIITNVYQLQTLANVDHQGLQLNSSSFTANKWLYGGMTLHGGKHYALTNDIDALATRLWNNGAGFAPIEEFKGVFDGRGYEIVGLHINRSLSGKNGGLFAINSGRITAVGIRDGYFRVGYDADGNPAAAVSVGMLVGKNAGSRAIVSYTHSSGFIDAVASNIGGLVGDNGAIIDYSYATAVIEGSGTMGSSNIGGLIGVNSRTGLLFSVYSAGEIYSLNTNNNLGNNLGGLVGNYLGGALRSSYAAVRQYIIQTSGAITQTTQSLGGGIIGNSANPAGGFNYWDATLNGEGNREGNREGNGAGNGESAPNRLARGIKSSSLKNCGLNGERLGRNVARGGDNLQLPVNCAPGGELLFPSHHWSPTMDYDDYALLGRNIRRGWIFNPGDSYPLLFARDIINSRNLLPAPTSQQCEQTLTRRSDCANLISNNDYVAGNAIDDEVGLMSDYDGDGIVDLYDNAFDVKGIIGEGSIVFPYAIGNIYQLQAIAGVDHTSTPLSESIYTSGKWLYGDSQVDALTKHYILLPPQGSMDAAVTRNWNDDGSEYGAAGFMPIGDCNQSFSIFFTLIFANPCDRAKASNIFSGSINVGLGFAQQEIRNLYINRPARYYTGMIGYGKSERPLANIRLTAADIRGGGIVGTLAGHYEQGDVEKVDVVARVRNSLGREPFVANPARVANSRGFTVLSATGGLVGSLSSGKIVSSTFSGAVSGASDTGGLVGKLTGEVLASSAEAHIVSSGNNVGGIAGWMTGKFNEHNMGLIACYASGYISALGNNVGGLVGNLQKFAPITASFSSFELSGSSDSDGNEINGRNKGGIVGYQSGSDSDISFAYATGDIRGSDSAGGIIGNKKQLVGSVIESTYYAGKINANLAGGLIGSPRINDATTSSVISASYWDNNVSVIYESNTGPRLDDGLSSKQLQSCLLGGIAFVDGVVCNTNGMSIFPRDIWDDKDITSSALGAINIGWNFLPGDAYPTLFARSQSGEELLPTASRQYCLQGTTACRQNNDPVPEFIGAPYFMQVYSKADNNTVIGKVTVMNEDNFSYKLLHSAAEFPFQINADNGEIFYTGKSLNKDEYDFWVVAEDINSKPQASAKVNVLLVAYNISASDADGDGVLEAYDNLPNEKGIQGDGSAVSPYVIKNIYQLQAIAGVDHHKVPLTDSLWSGNSWLYGSSREEQLAQHYVLANNIGAEDTRYWGINLPGVEGTGFMPIGDCGININCDGGTYTNDMPFLGTLNGNGYVINKLFINRSLAPQPTGLFGYIGEGAAVTGVGITDADIHGWYSSGIFIGFQDGGNLSESYVSDSSLYIEDSPSLRSASLYGGSLVGVFREGNVFFSYAAGTSIEINVNDVYTLADSDAEMERPVETIGGLVGVQFDGVIASSYAIGQLRVTNPRVESRVGGLVGYLVTGRITGSYSATSRAWGHSYLPGSSSSIASQTPTVGGLTGFAEPAGFLAPPFGSGTGTPLYDVHNSYWDIDLAGAPTTEEDTVGGAIDGAYGLTTRKMQGCGLHGEVIATVIIVGFCRKPSDSLLEPFYPFTEWSENIFIRSPEFEMTGWEFSPGDRYPTLSVIRSGGRSNLPSATLQHCHHSSPCEKDDIPPKFSQELYSFHVDTAAPNSLLGRVSAISVSGDDITYSIFGEDAALFAINSLGDITIASSLADSGLRGGTYSFGVMATTVYSISLPASVIVRVGSDSVRSVYQVVSGNGSQQKPYIINNIYQLQAIAGVDHEGTPLSVSSFTGGNWLYGNSAENQLTKHYKLGDDINASITSNWNIAAGKATGFIPIGDCSIGVVMCNNPQSYIGAFSGNFDGDDYKIDLLFINSSQRDGIGLFGATDGARISNLQLSNASISVAINTDVNNYMGSVVGYMQGGELSNIQIEGMVDGNSYVGGITGYTSTGLILNAKSSGVFIGTTSVGGISGYVKGTSVLGVSSVSRLYGYQESRAIGGLVGVLERGVIIGSYALTNITGRYKEVKRISEIGGLVGRQDGGVIFASYVHGDVIGKEASEGVGGLIGIQYGGLASHTYTTGHFNITVESGALVGEQYGGITSGSYSLGVPAIVNTASKLIGSYHSGFFTTNRDYSHEIFLLLCNLGVSFVASTSTPCDVTGFDTQLPEMGLNIMSPVFPLIGWGGGTYSDAHIGEIKYGWQFAPLGEYPVLFVRDNNDNDLLPSFMQQRSLLP